jgi:hypothetical protein
VEKLNKQGIMEACCYKKKKIMEACAMLTYRSMCNGFCNAIAHASSYEKNPTVIEHTINEGLSCHHLFYIM